MDVQDKHHLPRRWVAAWATFAMATSPWSTAVPAADTSAPTRDLSFSRAVTMLELEYQTDEAIRMLNVLASQGDSRAQAVLAAVHFDGELVPPDPVTGYAWLQVATSEMSYFREATASWAQQKIIDYGASMNGVQLIAAETLSNRILQAQWVALVDGILGALRARYTSVEPARIGEGYTVQFAEAIRVKVPDRAGESPLFSPGCALPGASGCPSGAAPDSSEKRCSGEISTPDRSASTNGPGADATASFYPSLPQMKGVEGRTIVMLHVDRSGWVCGASVVASSGSPDLDDAAIDAVRSWRLSPATLGGQPVESFKIQSLIFSMAGYGSRR